MKAIGYIVVIALIVFVALKFSKKKETKQEDGQRASSPDPESNPIQELIQEPAAIIQEKLNDLINTAHEKAVELNDKLPLANNFPNQEEVIIIPPRKIIQAEPTWQSPPAPVLTASELREPEKVVEKPTPMTISKLLNKSAIDRLRI